MAQQLSPDQRAALAKQYGVTAPTTNTAIPTITTSQTLQHRKLGTGPLEAEAKATTADQALAKQAVHQSATVAIPIKNISNQGGANLQEAKRAFADFTRESKPLEVSTSDLKQFGYDLFSGTPTTFAPATDIPIPPEYVVGPGDELKIHLFGRINNDLSLTVDRQGEISFPGLGPLAVARKSFAQLRAFIADQVKQKMVGISVSVDMGKLRSIRIFALGDVDTPGSYTVSGLATLSSALLASGGVKKIGSLRHIQLKRHGKLVTTLDLYDFLLHGNTSNDVRLLPGDVVFVPPIGTTVSIAGKVIRPAIYELKHEHTLKDILSLAGGLLPTAYLDQALIERVASSGDSKVIAAALKGQGLQTPVYNGDIVKVFSVLDFEKNPVLLIGNVKRPGKYAWHQGMRLSNLIANDKALLPETFMDYGLIEREASKTREPELLRFNIKQMLERKQGSDGNLLLKQRDKVYIFNRSHFRQQPMVKITGRVQSPGNYTLKKSMRLVDLIFASGGALRDAMWQKIELYRTDPQSKVISVRHLSLTAAMKGDKANNPLLHDLDRVVIHSIWEQKQRYSVQVLGEVKNPYNYVLADQGMHIADLVFAAGGVTERAYLAKAEITRYKVVNGEKRKSSYIEVNLKAALAGNPIANIALQPYDVLMVRSITNWRQAEEVVIKGEFRFPGSYPIEDGERLSSLISRAGGFNKDAYLPALVFSRKSLRKAQRKQLDAMAKRIEADITMQEAALTSLNDAALMNRKQKALEKAKVTLKQMQELKVTGRMVLTIASLDKFKGSDFDIKLKDGDTLFVPKRPDQVMVMGQVYNNTALVYRHGLDRDDYLSLAGGVTRMADEDNIYIVKASGAVVASNGWSRSARQIDPGDTVVVPQRLDELNLLDSALDWSKVLMQIGVATASMRTLGII